MKKLFIGLFIISCLFMSCKQPEDASKQEYQNNAVDSDFTIYTKSYGNSISVKSRNWLNGYERTSGSSGIIGSWHVGYDYYYKDVTFNSDGTYNLVTTYFKKDEVERVNGTYEVSANNDDFCIKIFYKTKEYNLKYVVSPKYFCHQDSGCPI